MNWKLIGQVLFWFGLGVLVHDYAHQVWELKGYHNLLEGGYIGLVILICGWIILNNDEIIKIIRGEKKNDTSSDS